MARSSCSIVCAHLDHDWCAAVEPARVLEWLEHVVGEQHVVAIDERISGALSRTLSSAAAQLGASALAVAAGADAFTVVSAIAARHAGRDVAYARGGVELPPEWESHLRRAMTEGDRIGVVSPLSDYSTIFSPFSGGRPDWMDHEQITRWLARLSHGHVFDVPVILPVCALYHHEALSVARARRGAGNAFDPVDAIRAAGWACVGCDWVFAGWPHGANAPDAPAPRDEDARQFVAHHPLGRIRHAFGEAAAWGAASVPDCSGPAVKPVQLHITHSWGGGLGRWIRDMCEADQARHNLILRSIGTWGAFGQRIGLYASHEMDVPLREWQLDLPIRSVATSHFQYRTLLADVIRDFEVDVLIVSSLIGHSLDVLDTGRPTVVAAHDYFPFCPALVIRFESPCTHCDAARLDECFSGNPLNRFFTHTNAAQWTAIRQRYLGLMQASHVRLVAPSASVIRHLHALAPELAGVSSAVVPNGIDFCPDEVPAPRDGRMRLVVLGSLAPHKGAGLLAEALPAILEVADVHLLGCGDEGAAFAHFDAVRITRHYAQDELPALMSDISPHAALMLSIVPETFSYTLSELWAMGIVPIATRTGAFADRISHGENGYLIAADAQALIGAVRHLDTNRGLLGEMRGTILATTRHGRREMVLAYHRILPVEAGTGMAGVGPVRLLETRSRQAHGALYVDRQVPIRLVIADFVAYLSSKTRNTPRLANWNRRLLLAVLTKLQNWIGARA